MRIQIVQDSVGSLEQRDSITRRLEFLALVVAVTTTTLWMWIGTTSSTVGLGWMGGFALVAVIFPALYGLTFLAINILYGVSTGRSALDIKFTNKAYPPSRWRNL